MRKSKSFAWFRQRSFHKKTSNSFFRTECSLFLYKSVQKKTMSKRLIVCYQSILLPAIRYAHLEGFGQSWKTVTCLFSMPPTHFCISAGNPFTFATLFTRGLNTVSTRSIKLFLILQNVSLIVNTSVCFSLIDF